MRFKVKAIGRERDAIGITHLFEDIVECDSKDQVLECVFTGKTESKKAWGTISKIVIFPEKTFDKEEKP
jgi:hypothetical protein